ncbi:NAD(P)/FAD-dependent oxidoreductase [Hamadaea tsunoensis]|uniref:NAD(P)/FAD-dependent oxidoreductase n=1 Tax=Hamadaea tsunoensis TaxID=53368 RepID=UPI00040C00B3|nr:FAD-binding oxidoreductase [Hamadaea tsunoensis]
MTTDTRAVVIGGGIVGCSVAYHLARLGWTDTILVEQHDLTDGTTWHSAGFVTALRGVPAHRKLVSYYPALARVLAAETGRDAGWRPVGGLRLATTSARVDELRRQAHAAEDAGIMMELRTASSAAPLAPLLDLDGVQAAAWLPGDGFVRPKDASATLAEAAGALGVQVKKGVKVSGLKLNGKKIAGVTTSEGTIHADTVVLATGAATASLGHLAGAAVPVVPLKHQYAVTAAFDPALDPDKLPTVRDPDANLYLRGAGGGLIIGGYATVPEPAWPTDGSAPLAEPRALFKPQSTEELAVAAAARVPGLPDIIKIVNGPEGFTPDGEPLIGATEVPGLWVAAGMGLHGLGLAGGAGKCLAELITAGQSEWDMQPFNPQRFGPFAHNRHWITTRAVDAFQRTFR